MTRDAGSCIPLCGGHGPGDADDNAAAESFMATFKTELVQRERCKRRDDACRAVFSYIEGFDDPHRLRSALGCSTSAEYEKMLRENRHTAVPIKP